MSIFERITVTGFNAAVLEGTNSAGEQVTIAYAAVGSGEYTRLYNCLQPGSNIGIALTDTAPDGTLLPQVLVVEPDYLLDISALAECVQADDNSAARYFYNKLKPAENAEALLLGNLANTFLDDIIHGAGVGEFAKSTARSYRNGCFDYLTCGTLATDKGKRAFMGKAARHYSHIYKLVRERFGEAELNPDLAVLEPAFICVPLGLQGRLDLLQLSAGGDSDIILELKSGTTTTIGSMPAGVKKNHEAQAMLYQLAIQFVLGRVNENIKTYIFYSRYHTGNLRRVRFNMRLVRKYLQLRNEIVVTELKVGADNTGNTAAKMLRRLNTETILGIKGNANRFTYDYNVPLVAQFAQVIQDAPEAVMAYAARFYAFIAREQALAKIGGNNGDMQRAHSSLWNMPADEKIINGEMLDGLELTDARTEEDSSAQLLVFTLKPGTDPGNAALRQGDAVVFYKRACEGDSVLNRQVFKGSVYDISAFTITIRLPQAQKGLVTGSGAGSYALEREGSDGGTAALYRGIYSFMQAPRQVQELLLGIKAPETDESIRLVYSYADKELERLLLSIKQAKDYYLLLGPPGTGKTSVVIRNLIREFYADEGCNILLLSYTNRAVDEMCAAVESLEEDIDYIRIGSTGGCGQAYRDKLLYNRLAKVGRRNDGSELIQQTRVFAATVSSLNNKMALLKLKRFDVVIIDEASQILEPMLLGLLTAIDGAGDKSTGRFIMVGDHKQLPAISLQEAAEGQIKNATLNALGFTDARTSMFERLYRLHEQQGNASVMSMLRRHGRMHEHVADFVNKAYYGGRLETVPLEHQHGESDFVIYDNASALQEFMRSRRLGIIAHGYSEVPLSIKQHEGEAAIAIEVLKALSSMFNANGITPHPEKSVGIITPYRAQIALLKQLIAASGMEEFAGITIDTVERYQGAQRDIIIYLFNLWTPQQAEQLANLSAEGDVVIDRKLNVALTRARKHVYVVGNAQVLRKCNPYRPLVEYCEARGAVLPWPAADYK